MVRDSFPGKVVLITGGSRGMGAAIAEAFAVAGAVCVINYYPDEAGENRRDAEAVAARCRTLGAAAAHCLGADVSRFDSVEAMVKEAVETAGGLDVLINNAGVLRDRTVRKMTPDDWHAVLRTNLDGVFFCSKAAAEVLRDGGRIVNLASIAGIVGFHGQANYAAAKAGVIALTKVMSKEFSATRHYGERRGAGGDPHADARWAQGRGAGRVRETDPRRPRWPAGGCRSCGAVPRL